MGPHTYKVKLVDHLGDVSGRCVPDKLLILLEQGQAPSALRDTGLHEVLHACMAPLMLDDEVEERIVHGLAPALLDVIRDNPDLIGWLQA